MPRYKVEIRIPAATVSRHESANDSEELRKLNSLKSSIFMGRRRRWRQETLKFRSVSSVRTERGGRLNCLAEHVSNHMTETELLGAGLLTGFFGAG